MLARYTLSSCVRRSDTSRHCTKRVKCRITQRTPYDSPGTLIFWRQRSRRNSNRVTLYGDAKYRRGKLKSAIFDQDLAISQKRYKIGTQLQWNTSRNLYMARRVVAVTRLLKQQQLIEYALQTMQSETTDFAPGAATWRTRQNVTLCMIFAQEQHWLHTLLQLCLHTFYTRPGRLCPLKGHLILYQGRFVVRRLLLAH